MSEASGRAIRCTLVLPAYNAMGCIDSTAKRLQRFVAEHPDWCVLVVCDGCTDGTPRRLAELWPAGDDRLRVESYERNRGKGYALRLGMSLAQTPLRVYTDIDLAYDPDEALKIAAELDARADVAVVNRANPDSCYLISPRDFPNIYKRHLMSRSFNWWLRKALPIRILDTQAGLKGLTAQAWEILGPRMTSEGFFFDVELLARAQVEGLVMREVAIVFRYADPTTVRMVKHGWQMIFDTLRLRRTLRKEARARRRGEPAPKPGAVPVNS